MKRVLLAVGLGGAVLFTGAFNGVSALWLSIGAALAAGFGWMLGGTPAGPSGSEAHTGSGPDGTEAGGGGGDGGGGGQ